MKKSLTFISIFLICNAGSSQTYDSMANVYFQNDSTLINFTDSLGQKQGFWVEYKTYRLIESSHTIFDARNTRAYKLAQGSYKNNKKSGLWEYFKGPECAINTYKTENYFEDRSIEEWKNDFTTYTYFSSDSNHVSSTVFYERDTIFIHCENKLHCVATVNGKELKVFEYADLDYEQFRIYLGVYARELLWIKEGE